MAFWIHNCSVTLPHASDWLLDTYLWSRTEIFSNEYSGIDFKRFYCQFHYVQAFLKKRRYILLLLLSAPCMWFFCINFFLLPLESHKRTACNFALYYEKQNVSLKCTIKAILIFYSYFILNSDFNIYMFFNDFLNQILFM